MAKITILHNTGDKASRAFISKFAGRPDVEVIDWYGGGREAWIAAGNTARVSAFPAVVVDIPAHRVAAEGGGVDIPAARHALRKVAGIADLRSRVTAINQVLSKSSALGRVAAPILTPDGQRRLP